MTDPTPLSPAAQAVLDAVLQKSNLSPTVPVAATALRAAAFQLSFGHATGDGILCEDDLYALAAELEAYETAV